MAATSSRGISSCGWAGPRATVPVPELRRRIEYRLTILQDEGSLAPGDNARRARFLYTVVSGLSIAQALPAETPRVRTEIEVLRTAAEYVLNERPP
ncbi:hypothetical protein [Cellulomonas fengjieae]|uniref:hypothetical protein n=1 Tax=Cellulomonas fengjieae TaxID=2819978 RepID=UPI001AAFB0DB|nr:hypothetical protein [Cellulomonas fengjieae]MBO3102417.1 hypothetical protein [Cellulomonas fengjieae]